jgi:hypothetical protein
MLREVARVESEQQARRLHRFFAYALQLHLVHSNNYSEWAGEKVVKR